MRKAGKTKREMVKGEDKSEIEKMVKEEYGLGKYDFEKKLNPILNQLKNLSKASLNNSKIVFARRNEKIGDLLKIADWSLEDNDSGRNKGKINLLKDLKVGTTPYCITVELYHPELFWFQSRKIIWLSYLWEEEVVDEINWMLKNAFGKNPPQISNKIASKKEEQK